MTEENAEKSVAKKQEKEKVVKVTTGAWWKSTAKSKTEETQEKPKAKAKAKPKPKKATPAPRKAKPAPKKKETKKVEESLVAEEAKTTTAPVPAAKKEEAAKPEKQAKAKPKPKSKKPVGRKGRAAKPAVSGSKAAVPEESAPVQVTEKSAEKEIEQKSKLDDEQDAKETKDGNKVEVKSKDTAESSQQPKPKPKPTPKPKQPERRAKPGTQGQQKPKQEPKKQEPQKKESSGKKPVIKLLINADEPEECRIAQVENGRLESFHVNTVVRERTKNNIYKGRIVSVEASLQAAFVEIGTGRNGFLPFSDIHPEYFKEELSEKSRKFISQQQWRKLKIEDVVQRGQEVLVQVVKEVTGNKGANMTTFLSLPGRSLVLMPGSDSSGISRKISGEEKRSRLREIMSDFNMPEGVGYIVRTASEEITKTALQQDLRYLVGLWKEIKKRGQSMEAPALVYEEQDTVVRFLRDHFVADIQEIIVDTRESFDQVTKFVEALPARQRKVQVKQHRGVKPIFNQNNIEEQIESIYQPQVPLPSGGSIVIDPTEALVAIDVNSGRTSQKGDFEKSIFLANMEAADELARQLRLRDLGGLIVVDFIDMRNKKNIRDVEKQVKMAMKRDKAKVDISRISRFGLIEISRQKMGAPIEKGSYRRCEFCEGRGVVRSVETQALYYLRRIQTGVSRQKIKRVEARLPIEVGQYLLNKKRSELIELENRHRATIDIVPRPEMKPNENKIEYFSAPAQNGKEHG